MQTQPEENLWRPITEIQTPAYLCKEAICCKEDDGTEQWYKNAVLHRDGDLPAYIGPDGTQMWFQNGLRHRDGGLPAIIWADGTQELWVNGKRKTRIKIDGGGMLLECWH